eukprot:517920-Rhodomonas_salina.1
MTDGVRIFGLSRAAGDQLITLVATTALLPSEIPGSIKGSWVKGAAWGATATATNPLDAKDLETS